MPDYDQRREAVMASYKKHDAAVAAGRGRDELEDSGSEDEKASVMSDDSMDTASPSQSTPMTGAPVMPAMPDVLTQGKTATMASEMVAHTMPTPRPQQYQVDDSPSSAGLSSAVHRLQVHGDSPDVMSSGQAHMQAQHDGRSGILGTPTNSSADL